MYGKIKFILFIAILHPPLPPNICSRLIGFNLSCATPFIARAESHSRPLLCVLVCICLRVCVYLTYTTLLLLPLSLDVYIVGERRSLILVVYLTFSLSLPFLLVLFIFYSPFFFPINLWILCYRTMFDEHGAHSKNDLGLYKFRVFIFSVYLFWGQLYNVFFSRPPSLSISFHSPHLTLKKWTIKSLLFPMRPRLTHSIIFFFP